MYTRINRDTWQREPYYSHYIDNIPCTYSLVVTLDISLLRREVQEHGYKLYALLIDRLTRAVNATDQLRYQLLDGQLVHFHQLHPSYTILNEDESFSSLWTEHHAHVATFAQRFVTTVATYSNTGQLDPQPMRPDVFSISMLPWLDFSSFQLHLPQGNTHLLPIFTLGKFVTENERTTIPLAIQVHHAVTDGYHVGQFVERLQQLCATASHDLSSSATH